MISLMTMKHIKIKDTPYWMDPKKEIQKQGMKLKIKIIKCHHIHYSIFFAICKA